MIDFWTLGPTAAAFGLRARGFAPQEAERLVALKLRHERGEFRELTDRDWLERHRPAQRGFNASTRIRCAPGASETSRYHEPPEHTCLSSGERPATP